MRKLLVLAGVILAFAAQAAGQSKADEARKEIDEGSRAFRMGKYEEAQRRFERALELDPAHKDAPLFIARAAQRQYKPGVETPENVAKGERAVAAYERILARDPANADAFRAILHLYQQMKNEEKLRASLLRRANEEAVPVEARAEAFTILASKLWQCSYDVTEQKENKETVQQPDRVIINYKRPADDADFLKARQCAEEGLAFAEQATQLAPSSANAWAYKSNLLREAAKLAEMDGDAGTKADYERQAEEARERHASITGVAPPVKKSAAGAGTPAAAEDEPGDEARPKRTTVSGGVLNSKAVSKPTPVYPEEARQAGAQGTVTVQIVIDEEGKVISAQAVSGHPLLQQAAVEAARQARFSPTLLRGEPVRVSGVITFNFTLQ